MKRKLVKQGETTLMVSLPREWILKNQLEKGAEVTISPYSNSLLVTAPDEEMVREITLKLTNDLETAIRAKITAAYRAGYSKVRVEYQTQDQLKTLTDTVSSRLIGYEVTQTETDSCLVEMVGAVNADLFTRLLRKIYFAVEQTFECLQNHNIDQLESAAANVQRFDNFCKRLICTGRAVHHDSEFLYAYLLVLVHGQRELYYAAKLQEPLDTRTEELLSRVRRIYEVVKQAYLDKDFEILSETHDLQHEVFDNDISVLCGQLSEEQVKLRYRLISAARRFYQSNSQLAAVLLTSGSQ